VEYLVAKDTFAGCGLRITNRSQLCKIDIMMRVALNTLYLLTFGSTLTWLGSVAFIVGVTLMEPDELKLSGKEF